MYIDVYRDYCLSLGADVEEKLPFVNCTIRLAIYEDIPAIIYLLSGDERLAYQKTINECKLLG